MAANRVPKPSSKMKEFDAYKKKHGRFHDADPRNPMNTEQSETRKTKMIHGGMGKKKPKMMGGGMGKYKKPMMAHGGMANGKKHMYSVGGSVMDNLTSGQKKMVMAMAKDNNKS